MQESNIKKAGSAEVRFSFSKPLTQMERVRPMLDGLPEPKAPFVEVCLEMADDFTIKYEIKLTTKHEMHLELSDVFSTNLGGLFEATQSGHKVVFKFCPMQERKFVGLETKGRFTSWECLLHRFVMPLDLLLTIMMAFDIEPRGLYTAFESVALRKMIIHYSDLLSVMEEIFTDLYDKRHNQKTQSEQAIITC